MVVGEILYRYSSGVVTEGFERQDYDVYRVMGVSIDNSDMVVLELLKYFGGSYEIEKIGLRVLSEDFFKMSIIKKRSLLRSFGFCLNKVELRDRHRELASGAIIKKLSLIERLQREIDGLGVVTNSLTMLYRRSGYSSNSEIKEDMDTDYGFVFVNGFSNGSGVFSDEGGGEMVGDVDYALYSTLNGDRYIFRVRLGVIDDVKKIG